MSPLVCREIRIVAWCGANIEGDGRTDGYDSGNLGERTRNWANQQSEGVQQNLEEAKDNVEDLQHSVEEAQVGRRCPFAAHVVVTFTRCFD